jgi:hypothetical protein
MFVPVERSLPTLELSLQEGTEADPRTDCPQKTRVQGKGRLSNELCVWAIPDPITEEDAKRVCREIPDFDQRLAHGRIEKSPGQRVVFGQAHPADQITDLAAHLGPSQTT